MVCGSSKQERRGDKKGEEVPDEMIEEVSWTASGKETRMKSMSLPET
jgi:hypothetical protein